MTPLGYADREKTQRWAMLIAPVSTHAPTHASSHNHALAPPSARRLCTCAHTDRHTAGQPTACAARDAVSRHTRTHARTQPHPRISTTHRGRAEAHRGRRSGGQQARSTADIQRSGSGRQQPGPSSNKQGSGGRRSGGRPPYAAEALSGGSIGICYRTRTTVYGRTVQHSTAVRE